ncbi:MAG: hypothetical protein WAS21_19160 [Geminicoccaceae bacterium]
MLQIVSFPIDDVALVAAPATGAVAVVDATARVVLEGLRNGESEAALVTRLSRRCGVDRAVAAGHIADLRRTWTTLARPLRRRTRPASFPQSTRPPALDAVCDVGPVPVRLRIWPPRLAALVGAVTAPCRGPGHDWAGVANGPTLDACRVGRCYLLFRDGAHLLSTDSLMIARSEMLRHLVLASHPDRAWMAVLHGAGVAGPDGAALLCGSSGADKSTLTAMLLADGLDLVTDDYAPLEVGSNKLWPVPFGLSVKEGSWGLLAPRFPDIASAPVVRTRGRRQRYIRPPRMASTPQHIRCLVFPLYRAGTPFELLKLRAGEALELCARSGGWYESSRERLQELTRWLERTPAYALSYGDGVDAVAAVRRLLDA